MGCEGDKKYSSMDCLFKIIGEKKILLLKLFFFILGCNVTILAMGIWFNLLTIDITNVLTIIILASVLILIKLIFSLYKQSKILSYMEKYTNSKGNERVLYFFKLAFYVTFSFPKYKKIFNGKQG